MNLIKVKGKYDIYAAGDIHGEFKSLIWTIKTYNLHDCIIVCCGDIGVGFEKEQYYNIVFGKINTLAKKHNIRVFFGRGNHDNPYYFNEKPFILSNVQTLSDYSVIDVYGDDDIHQHSILYVGGAFSTDRYIRKIWNEDAIKKYSYYHHIHEKEAIGKAKSYYWEDEPPVFDINKINEIKECGVKIDIVCSHTAPLWCEPINIIPTAWNNYDSNIKNDTKHEREIMGKIHDRLIEDEHPLKRWYYGHFHHSTSYINSEDGVIYKMLDMVRNGKLFLSIVYDSE